MTREMDILIPLTTQDLDLLEWLGQWTPEVHRANWRSRRQWSPGFREVADTSATHPSNPKYKAIEDRMANAGDKRAPSRIARKLLPYGLVEGVAYCARLTARGRAALKLYGRKCPDSFKSHCPDIFDDVDLRVRYGVDFKVSHMDSLRYYNDLQHGDIMEDTPELWRAFLTEYNENNYAGRGSSARDATVRLLPTSSNGTPLNGSLQEHNRYLSLAVKNNAGRTICEIDLSLEQFSDMLTSNSEVPCTVSNYFDTDGMRRAEPAAPPLSAYRRMQARLEKQTQTQAERIDALLASIEEGKFGKMGKKGQAALVHELKIAKDLGVKNAAYVAEQTLEEVSAVVEGAGTIIRERAAKGHLGLHGTALAGLLGGEMEEPPMLIDMKTAED